MLSFDFFAFFFFSALVSASRILLQSSQSLPVGSYSYSATTAQSPSVESTILLNFGLVLLLIRARYSNINLI